MTLKTVTLKVPNTYRPLTVSSGIRTSALKYPKRIALKTDDRSLSYERLINRIDRLAHAALEMPELNLGDHVAVLGPNSIEYLETVLALSDAQNPVVTLSARLSAAELLSICNDANVKVLFIHPDCIKTIESIKFKTVVKTIVFGDQYEAVLTRSKTTPFISKAGEWDVFSIPFTSGTTGSPKGVMLPHRARALLFYSMAVEYECFGSNDSFLAIAPFAHGAGLAFALISIFFGGTCHITTEFNAIHVTERLSKGGFTGVFMVPTHLHAILQLNKDFLSNNRPTSLKSLISNAAPLPQSVKERIIDLWGKDILHETYGSTEVGIACNLQPKDQLRKTSCVGLSLPNCANKILNEEGFEVAPNEVGELYTNSPFIFNGYWRDGKVVSPILNEGWFSAGDLAKKDEEGFIYIVGRKTDLVISGGINIYPRQIEETLHRHPGISEAAVIGVPDDQWGEKLRAFIVTYDGQDINSDELTKFCKLELSSFKIPKDFVLVDYLPRNPSGKILKRLLKKL